MSKEAVFTMKLEPELRAAFMAEAEALDRPASQVVREFIQRQQESRAYDAFVAEKVQAARADVRAGRVRDNAEVEAEFAARRAALRAGA